ncbi:MAG: hypothetical protein GDA56_20105 [Hormoscilla sp. GM7CHS1pb]|nr:hypothetical protein [Hormoscilla sp. GM7CHS1pb]
MPNQFKDFFDYGGPDPNPTASDTAYLFHNVLATQTTSVGCYKALFEFFMDVLKLNSQRYRHGLDNSVAIAYGGNIPDSATLDRFVTYLPEDLKIPANQVLFENWDMEEVKTINTLLQDNRPIRNAYGFKVYTATTQAAAETAFNQIKRSDNAKFFKELRTIYAARTDKKHGVAPPTLADGADDATTNKALNDLAKWIEDNIPPNYQITNLTDSARTVTDMLEGVFGSSTTTDWNLNGTHLPAILQSLLDKIKGTARREKVNKKKDFSESVLKRIKEEDYWKNNWKAQYDELNNFGPKLDSNQPNQIIDKIALLWKDALVPGTAAQAKPVIEAILTAFVGKGTQQGEYLKGKLVTTLKGYKEGFTGDPKKLRDKALAKIPSQISIDMCQGLLAPVGDMLASVPLQFRFHLIDPNPKMRLFQFTNYQDLSQSSKFVFPVGNEPGVEQDAKEYNTQDEKTYSYFRPLVYLNDLKEIKKSNPNGSLLCFFNVDTDAGTFYVTDDTHPTTVVTPEYAIDDKERKRKVDPRKDTTIDFREYKINGKDADSEGKPYRVRNGSRNDASNFYATIKKQTKWSELKGSRPYDALYQTVDNTTPTPFTAHLIWRLPSGSGLSRADRIDASLCLWEWVGKEAKYSELGSFLGLPKAREIVRDAAANKITINEQEYTVIQQARKAIYGVSGFYYEFLEIQEKGKESETYVRVNLPHHNLPASLDSALARRAKSTALSDDQRKILDIFQFKYYRKVDTTIAGTPKVIKSISKKGSTSRRPNVSDGVEIKDKADYTTIGINLPISFCLQENLKAFKDYAGIRYTLKNKNRVLYRQKGPRKDASGTMSKLVGHLKAGLFAKASTLPATYFADTVIAKCLGARIGWKLLKVSSRNSLTVNQEWCHLQGHGDGGDERLGNFVSGSYHCNTEQLAIETGQRNTTQIEPEGTFYLRTTAYLFDDKGKVVDSDYLQDDTAYGKIDLVTGKLQTPKVRSPRETGKTAPIAAFIRYKIYQQDAATKTLHKCFDYIFEGQSEFIDEYHFKILSTTVEFVLAGKEAFDKWYEEEKDAGAAGAGAAKKAKVGD